MNKCLDFFGITIFSGFLTIPIYATNLSNIGWFLWSMPAILIIYFSFEYRVKFLILTYLFLLVFTNDESNLFQNLEVFKDVSTDFAILTRSCAETNDTIKWEDGKEYPLVKMEISSDSHPFYTGKQKIIDSGGRVQKFEERFGKK